MAVVTLSKKPAAGPGMCVLKAGKQVIILGGKLSWVASLIGVRSDKGRLTGGMLGPVFALTVLLLSVATF